MAKTKQSNYSRTCPSCGISLFYSTQGNCDLAIRNNKLCGKCASKNRNYHGVNNPFYGKFHSEITKEKMREADKSYTKTLEFKEKATQTLKLFWNDGKNFYDYWLEKYGEEEANRRFLLTKKKHSQNHSGKGNPMFGRPPTKGTGDGWSGWYKDWYFRSLLELSYVINVLNKDNRKWESAERKELGMPYVDWQGNSKIYFADFLLDGYILVEIKPKRMINTPRVLIKKKAALDFCELNKFQYEIITPDYLNKDDLIFLYKNGIIKFSSKSEKQFLKYHELL